jgi:hypothetical protein
VWYRKRRNIIRHTRRFAYVGDHVRLPPLAVKLVLFGVGVGAIDVAVHTQAIVVERASSRSMMSGFHGLFSVGGIVHAAGVTALVGTGASPFAATPVVVAGIVATLTLAAPIPYARGRASASCASLAS